ncbi:MAG: DUF1553 domain-containing protein, partial [Phycisphaeraceae bacterium]
NITSDQRAVTTVALQQLFVLNSDFMIHSAKALATRLAQEADDDAGRIRRAFELLFARSPSEQELQLGLRYVSAEENEGKQLLTRWERYCQALLGTNEMMYVD